MKKRTMVLGGLLMAVAITGYSVSGTYAKYISGIDETDEARVARWSFGEGLNEKGVSDLFASSYSLEKNDPSCTKNCTYTYVQSMKNADGTNDDVIAPGTSGEYTFEINGEMETNYILNIAIDGDKTYNNVLLTNADIYTAAELKKLGLTGTDVVYNPLRFRIYKHTSKEVDDGAGNISIVDTTKKGSWLTYDEFIKAFNKEFNPTTVDSVTGATNPAKTSRTAYVQAANKSADFGTYTIEWAWAFDAKEVTTLGGKVSTSAATASTANYFVTSDEYDTKLGNKIITGMEGLQAAVDKATTTAAKDKARDTFIKTGKYPNVSLNVNISATQTTCEAGTLVSDCTK